MRARFRYLPAIARATGFAVVAIAMIATALHFHAQSSRIGTQRAKSATAADPLGAELKLCELIAEQAKDDPACEAAWTENRRRFFTYASSPGRAAQPKTNGR
ncbi:MAG: putative entry exclusion protein TrbK-alt [Acetobacteraceae bacterium]